MFHIVFSFPDFPVPADDSSESSNPEVTSGKLPSAAGKRLLNEAWSSVFANAKKTKRSSNSSSINREGKHVCISCIVNGNPHYEFCNVFESTLKRHITNNHKIGPFSISDNIRPKNHEDVQQYKEQIDKIMQNANKKQPKRPSRSASSTSLSQSGVDGQLVDAASEMLETSSISLTEIRADVTPASAIDSSPSTSTVHLLESDVFQASEGIDVSFEGFGLADENDRTSSPEDITESVINFHDSRSSSLKKHPIQCNISKFIEKSPIKTSASLKTARAITTTSPDDPKPSSPIPPSQTSEALEVPGPVNFSPNLSSLSPENFQYIIEHLLKVSNQISTLQSQSNTIFSNVDIIKGAVERSSTIPDQSNSGQTVSSRTSALENIQAATSLPNLVQNTPFEIIYRGGKQLLRCALCFDSDKTDKKKDFL